MKVLLIAPPLQIAKEMEEFARVYYPTGLAYIASNLEKNNFKVSIIDALAQGWDTKIEEGQYTIMGLSKEKLKELIKKENPDFCGISAMFTSQCDQAHKVAKIVKELYPNIKVALGGPHASAAAADVLKDINIDFVILGEGEVTLLNLLKNIKHPEKVKGLAYKKNNKINFTKPAEFINDLDSLPFPAYHLLDMQNYFDAGAKGFSARRYVGSSEPWATIVTSRGCPFDCIFCSIHNTMGYKWRARSPKNVVDEIEYLYNQYKVRTFFFEDDNFTLDLVRAKEILKEIKKRNLNINWQAPNGIRADLLDEELVSLIKETNCTRVRVAIEHGDQEFLNNVVNKKLDLQKLKEGVKLLRKYKLDVDGFFIVGIPGETDETMKNSINFAKELSALGLNPIIGIATPLYGTKMYNICKNKGYLVKDNFTSHDYQLAYSKEPLINTPTMSVSNLKKWYFKAFKSTLLVRAKKNPLVLLNLNIVQEFKRHPLRAMKIFYSYFKKFI